MTSRIGCAPCGARVSGAPALIGCGPVGCVVGAESLAESAGVWLKTHFHRQGPFLCATVYAVSAGEPRVIELRVDLRPIARAVMRAHAAMHASTLARASLGSRRSASGATVGWGLGSLWKGAKKAAKKIGRNKLVKGVVGVTKTLAKGAKTVIKSKVTGLVAAGLAAFPLTAPIGVAALGAYAAANAALTGLEAGNQVVKTARDASTVLREGDKAARALSGTKARTNAAVQAAGAVMSPADKQRAAARVKAAGTLKLTAGGKAAVAATLARTPAADRAKVASAIASKFKGLAALKSRVALIRSLPPAASAAVEHATRLEVAATPAIARAQKTRAKLAEPAVRARLLDIRARGDKSRALLSTVAARAKTGDLDAQKSALIVNLVARNRARIQAMSQANAGGLPGVLITRDGRLRRGRWRVQAVADQGGLLYAGRGKSERGAFQTVSGTQLFGEPVEVESGEGVRLSSIAVNGDLPLDGVRLQGRGPAASDIGPYESDVSGPLALIGCGSGSCCASCAAKTA